MTFKYIKDAYGLEFKRGQRVQVMDGRKGQVTSATHHVKVRIDGRKAATPFHPTDVEAQK